MSEVRMKFAVTLENSAGEIDREEFEIPSDEYEDDPTQAITDRAGSIIEG